MVQATYTIATDTGKVLIVSRLVLIVVYLTAHSRRALSHLASPHGLNARLLCTVK